MKIVSSLKQRKNVLLMDYNVKRMDENTANGGEEKEWGRYRMEARMIGARKKKVCIIGCITNESQR